MTELNKAFSTMQIKSFDEATRTFKGIATTITADRMEDVVEPKGATFALPIPFIHQHDALKPVGWITAARVTAQGIEVEGKVDNLDGDPNAPASLVERLNVAWYEMKRKLVRGLSIGFRPIQTAFDKTSGGMIFQKWEWLELSPVTIPANAEATITNIKSIAVSQRAAPGNRSDSNPLPARAGATTQSTQRGQHMKTYTNEALDALKTQRETKAARMAELREVKATESRPFSAEERAEFNALDVEIDDIDDEIKVTQKHVSNISVARPIERSAGNGGAPYGYVKRADPEEKFKGQNGTRMVIAKAVAAMMIKEGVYLRPSEVAEMRWGKTNPQLVAVIKANEVAGGGSGSGEWGAELVAADNRYTGDFVEYLYNQTAFDKLALREVPANVAIKGQDGQFTGYWVGQSKAIPMSAGDFSSTSTTPLKVAALTVVSNELLRDSSPAAEALVRDALANALAQRIDTTFFSATAASAGVSPAGILNGLAAVAASNGPDAQSIRTDFRALLAPFIAAKNVRGLVIVTTPSLAAGLGLMVNALGQTEFPGVTAEGGSLLGYPIVVGDNVGTGDVILLDPKEIWKIGDLGVKISVSQEAMIEQSTVPTGATDTPVAASQAFTSMFQEESTAIKIVRPINFAKRRSTAVSWIDDAAYGAEAS